MQGKLGSEKGSFTTFLRYVTPSVAAMLLFSLYTVVDGIFVAKGAGELAVTSVNIALPFVSSLSGISILLSMGTATLVSFAIGEKNMKEANRIFSQTLALMVLISAVITATVATFAEPLAQKLGASAGTLADTTAYLRIISLFAICFIVSYCLEVMVKVDDQPYMAIVGVGASFVTNIILDYLFVIVWDYGVRGAAWATGIAQVVSLVIFLGYFFFSPKATLKIGRFSPNPRLFFRIFPLGVADCSVELIISFLTILYNRILLHLFGESSLTVFAVIAYLNLFVFMIMQGVAQGMMHLVSLYVGKGEDRAAQQYFRMCIFSSLALSVLCVVVCYAFPQQIAGLILEEGSSLMGQTVDALKQYALSFPLVGINIAVAAYLTARELAVPSIVISVGRGFVFAPLALLTCAFLGNAQYIWFAACLGELACLVLSLVLLKRAKKAWASPLVTP